MGFKGKNKFKYTLFKFIEEISVTLHHQTQRAGMVEW